MTTGVIALEDLLMRRHHAGLLAAISTIAGTLTVFTAALPAADRVGQRPSLESRLEAMRSAGSLPAVAGAVFRTDETLASAAVGVRKLGDPTPVTTSDLWHIGSITKSFTSLVVAKMVDRGDLSWDATLGSLVGADVAKAYAPVTLLNLLSHRSGLPANVPNALTIDVVRSGVPVVEQRARLLRELFSTTPGGAPGETFLYSNAGFIVMGAILEAKTGQPWETLVRTEVFEPLSLTSAGFGPPGTADAPSQPWGHRQTAEGLTPMAPSPMADNPAFLGPAGTIHLTVADLVRWGQEHMRGEQGEPNAPGLVSTASFRRLHQPPLEGADYALGWSVLPMGRQRMIWHNGSNTMWYAIVGFNPEEGLGVVLVTNGGIGAGPLLDAGVRQVFGDWAR
jgi:CubicO group peptidase (beta-lactamase class C family)